MSSSTVPHALVPAIEVLAGRACLSSLGFAPGELPTIPLYAASGPALDSSSADPRGGVVLTVIRGVGRSTVTVSGTGLAGTEAGAQAFLLEWMEGLTHARRSTSPPKRVRAPENT